MGINGMFNFGDIAQTVLRAFDETLTKRLENPFGVFRPFPIISSQRLPLSYSDLARFG
jgi:hypothetical protein